MLGYLQLYYSHIELSSVQSQAFLRTNLKSETDHMLDDTVLALVSGEDSGRFLDCDASLSYLYHIHTMMRFPNLIRERMKVTLNFLILGESEWQCMGK